MRLVPPIFQTGTTPKVIMKEYFDVESSSRQGLAESVLTLLRKGWEKEGYAFIKGLKFVQRMWKEKK